MKISIITVCLNSERTIEQTIQSVVSQKDRDMEYIIIDGNSTDKTLKIVEQYSDDIDIIVSEPDRGIYDAMNKGILQADGDIIGIINSDDWYEPGIFKKVRKCFLDSNADIIHGKMNQINAVGEKELINPADMRNMGYAMMIFHPTVFVKKSIYEKYGLFSLEYKIAADYELMLRYYLKGVKFVCLDDVLANFRVGGISNKQGKICAYETYSISKKYLYYFSFSERRMLENKIESKLRAYFFKQLLYEYENDLLNSIKENLNRNQKVDLALFGAGRWGRDMFNLLSGAGLFPLHVVDNNRELWGNLIGNVKISSPDVLRSFDGIILILVKGYSEEILSQIKKMNNSALDCVTWEELTDEIKGDVFPG